MTQRETARTNGSVGRTARVEAGSWHGLSGNVGRTARDETGKRHGRGGNVGRTARDETGKQYGRERKRRAGSARRDGKPG